ncbi:hypothetical protein [Hymenobacter ruricola]|uniref:Uncharacterized protein n=1 Tax=Hymenobacter ruricola TaxID=2791023 RepID=A0ABS0I7S3_9BACT|nr:hypothetical protein [Hymenobacter ruricola]MBF9223021.1 hypothetical protein [Hymenobacter ruricola]
MLLTTYERLRITHRTLLHPPLAPAAFRQLVQELPAHLNDIEAQRPGLQNEVAGCRDYVERLAGYLAGHADVDHVLLVEGLHRCLASLFGK